MTTIGEALISLLEAHGVDTVFGIPGVHTVELYRGLARSRIRHVTPRHEQGAGFMADGYARAGGRPGVAFVITGPGLTNTITAMAQARADSVPMLVISGVNATPTLGKGLGFLHELPDQRGMMEKVALFSQRITEAGELPGALARAFALFSSSRPGPVHIEIPTDVMVKPADGIAAVLSNAAPPAAGATAIAAAASLCAAARHPLILAGGGAKRAEDALRRLAERLGAPVVETTNARGLLHRHPLCVPASPSLKAIRALMGEADLVIAAGTEFGPTDYDGYGDGGFVLPANLIRIDIGADQLARRPATVAIQADCAEAIEALLAALGSVDAGRQDGKNRAAAARKAARAELTPVHAAQVHAVEAIRDALPGAIIVGDSTQPVYAANLYYDHDRPGGWFNAATGFGALGYGPPAAVGAALAMPDAPIVCLTGDGGFQFTLPELGAALDAAAPVIFVVWNNRGYREIETSMLDVGVEPVGVSPAPPDFCKLAEAYGIGAERIADTGALPLALKRARATGLPRVIEITVE
ncbi:MULTISPECIES: 5-guanidino-2-oxopentanoate decarboxylase [unclassified Mesorhizobium]|uniref:5-guanidino-2-oxopentanoate decarboxylase n=1 Tax=unclassified Mesorhizobium TaxID=325217 RepID=UPI00112811D4|nr:MULTISPECIES: 5-guanidino-2-oxopentanoate decarboxylase [unclassified Mesorhizobium]MBZ9705051.1 5-guanidino-2-oxopentanoate decarboxylase [Mesorhizobium sp. CO1-1-3]MBZ9896016.1 5-guanidino-2-oxopentanoate decarboxylase [Mesorhizobium sp. BR1-1-6]MBZ9947568.1 5-guanidino-2-oxopentanoate decarboxylase [Mesorhizobium sp. BR1-1-11]MBZ9961547.1 5-guanidino-2-oxopentanoate decarboxylase [Mesorhizobium sp. BR1-1-14]MCA0059304.1 5-guanidino-2-oxopentanoate decarboxylase [Mesorhizobium sp. B261B1A